MTSSLNELSCDKSQLNFLNKSDDLLNIYSSDQYFTSGKNIRGKLCNIIGKHLNIEKEEHITSISNITDYLHNASLIHDDIIDNDEVRRGQLSIWRKYGVGKAILIGDYLISKSYDEVNSMHLDDSLKMILTNEITKTLNESVKGAHLELQHSDPSLITTFNKYIEITTLKTGSLFSLPFRCLYNLTDNFNSSKSNDIIKAFYNLAVAYQIKDDWIDYKSSQDRFENNSDFINNRPNIFNVLRSRNNNKIENIINESQKNIIKESWEKIKKFNEDLFFDLNDSLDRFINFDL